MDWENRELKYLRVKISVKKKSEEGNSYVLKKSI